MKNRFFDNFCISVLISTYWNVNFNLVVKLIDTIAVLISTYWNVNVCRELNEFNSKQVLISTYWNVNESYFPQSDHSEKF